MATTAPAGAAASPASTARRPAPVMTAAGGRTPAADAASATAAPVAATPAAVMSGCAGVDDAAGSVGRTRRVTAGAGGARAAAREDGGTPSGKMVRAASLSAASRAAAVPMACAATPDARMPAHMRRPPATLFMVAQREGGGRPGRRGLR